MCLIWAATVDRRLAVARVQEIVSSEARMYSRGSGKVMHRTSSRVLLIVAAFVLFLVPVAAIAAGGFTDVEDDSVFKADVAWLADAGVTKGCNPPTNDRFCPEDNVTREQMAAFMHRLAVNKVVDAKTAMDADKLDGKDSTAFAVSGHDHDSDYLALDGKALAAVEADFALVSEAALDADNAGRLDDKDSTAFMQHGTIVTTMGPEGWLPHTSTPPSTVGRYISQVTVSGDGYMVHGLNAPASFNGVEYGLASVEVCVQFLSGAYLDLVTVFRTDGADSSGSILADSTNRTATGCYAYKVGQSLNKGGGMFLDFKGGGTALIRGTTLTWTTDAAVLGTPIETPVDEAVTGPQPDTTPHP
jgi:hypothetical protein